MLGLQSFALLVSVDGGDPEGVLFGGVIVLDQQLGLLLGHLHLPLLPTCSGPEEETEEHRKELILRLLKWTSHHQGCIITGTNSYLLRSEVTLKELECTVSSEEDP